MKAIYLSNDLMFGSRVKAVADQQGVDLVLAANQEALLAKLTDDTNLMILDLTCQACDPQSIVPAARAIAAELRIVAYGPHVREKLLADAVSAGCDQVLSNGQFNADIAGVLLAP